MVVAAAFVGLAALALTRVDPTRREDDAVAPTPTLAPAA
jgi:hypothetical protein